MPHGDDNNDDDHEASTSSPPPMTTRGGETTRPSPSLSRIDDDCDCYDRGEDNDAVVVLRRGRGRTGPGRTDGGAAVIAVVVVVESPRRREGLSRSRNVP